MDFLLVVISLLLFGHFLFYIERNSKEFLEKTLANILLIEDMVITFMVVIESVAKLFK